MSQSAMAKTAASSLPAWQGYEAGKNVPGGKVLEALARMGFNVNWLLTGEGVMWRESSGGWWPERMKEIRGDMSIPEFVNKVGFVNPAEATATIQAIEDGKMEADWSLMVVLNTELGIDPRWMFDGGGQMKRAEADATSVEDHLRFPRNVLDVEEDMLEVLSHKISEVTKQMGVTIHQDKLITLSMILYKFYSRNFLVDPEFRNKHLEYLVKALVKLTLPDYVGTESSLP